MQVNKWHYALNAQRNHSAVYSHKRIYVQREVYEKMCSQTRVANAQETINEIEIQAKHNHKNLFPRKRKRYFWVEFLGIRNKLTTIHTQFRSIRPVNEEINENEIKGGIVGVKKPI